MDDAGNILIRRYSKSNVYIKSTATNPNEETAIGAEIMKLPNQAIESEKIVKVCCNPLTLFMCNAMQCIDTAVVNLIKLHLKSA